MRHSFIKRCPSKTQDARNTLAWIKSNSCAIESERQIKGWTRRKKEALIAGDFDLLKKLSNEKNNAKIEAQKDKENNDKNDLSLL